MLVSIIDLDEGRSVNILGHIQLDEHAQLSLDICCAFLADLGLDIVPIEMGGYMRRVKSGFAVGTVCRDGIPAANDQYLFMVQ